MSSLRELSARGARFVVGESVKAGFTAADPSWINLGQGQPELGRLPNGPERITKIEINEGDYGYGPVDGLMDLRARVAEHYNRLYRKGMASQYGPENVSIAAGGRVCMSRALGALDKTTLGLFSPDYMAFEDVTDLFSRITPKVMRLSETDGFAVPLKQLNEDIQAGKLGALLMSNPRNPTGNVVSGEDLNQLVGTATNAGCSLILDEYYSHYIWNGEPRPVSAAAHIEDVNASSVMIIDGITKNFRYPGLRLGWIVGSKETIRKVSAIGSVLDGGPPTPTQRAAIQLLHPTHADQEISSWQPLFAEKREFMIHGLKELGVVIPAEPAGTFYVYGSIKNLPTPISTGLNFFREALEHKIATVPGEFFDLNPGGRNAESSTLNHYMRFSFGPNLSALKEGLERLKLMVQ